MVVPAGDHPAQRVGVEGRGGFADLVVDRQLLGVDDDADPGKFGDVADVGEQTVADIDHGRRTRGSGQCTCGVGRLGPAMRVDDRARRAEAPAEYGQSRRSPSEPTAHGKQIPGLGAVAAHQPRS